MSEPSTPASLFDAVRADDAAAVRALLEQDPALADTVAGRLTPLGHAAACGADAALRALLDAGVPPDPAEGADLVPPLVAAARHGCHAAAETLLIYGANVDARDPATQDTPLLAAASAGDAKMVRHFVSWGADLEATNPQGLTAYQIAHRAGDELVMKRLVDGGADDTPAPEPERIAIRYRLTLDDAQALFRFLLKTHDRARSVLRRYVIVYPLTGLAFGGLLAVCFGSAIPFIVCASVVALYMAWYGWCYCKLNAEGRASAVRDGLLLEQEMELSCQDLTWRRGDREARFDLATVDRIVTTDRHVYIFTSPSEAHIIPRDKVIEGDLDDFVARLTERWEAQRGEATEQDASSL